MLPRAEREALVEDDDDGFETEHHDDTATRLVDIPYREANCRYVLRVESNDVELGSPLCPLDLIGSQGPHFVWLVVNVGRCVVGAYSRGYKVSKVKNVRLQTRYRA
jgi:hypothetical protein